MKNLIIKEEYDIRQIEKKTKINPGTIHRYLKELINLKLVALSRTEKNEKGFTVNYYRATAKKFIVNIEIS